MPTEVTVTDEFAAWYDDLSEAEQDRVAFTVGLLEERGVTLPHPYASAIKGATFALRELRTQAEGDPLRTFYDSTRRGKRSCSSAETRPETIASTTE
jgi:hypothetical protein